MLRRRAFNRCTKLMIDERIIGNIAYFLDAVREQ